MRAEPPIKRGGLGLEVEGPKGPRGQNGRFHREEPLGEGQPNLWAGEFRVGTGYDSQKDPVTDGD